MDQTTDIQASEELTLPGNHAAASADGLVVDNANDNAGQEEGFEIVLKDDEKPKQDPATNAEFARRRIERKRQRELEQQMEAVKRGEFPEHLRVNPELPKQPEALTARGQNITMRGQDLSASTARRGQDLAMQRASTRGTAGNDERTVQLSDGRTVTVGGKLHGAGANAFYEGIDNEGNMVRVPASSIAAPATSSASAQNYAMKKDIDAIANADASALDFMTGMTGGAGNPAIGADVRSRLTGKEQRQLYNSAQRIQGRMQNQGVAAARDMGASGINTVAEAKMYFQGMPQVDYSSPEAMQQSIREIQEYTNNYNQQYNVNVGKSQRQQSQPTQVSQPAASSNFSSLWGD